MPTLLLLATHWGRKHGGINAFNQDLATGLASLSELRDRVFCAVLAPDQRAFENARSAGVTLVPIEKPPVDRFDSSWVWDIHEWLKANARGVTVDWWIGHDLTTGDAALKGAETYGGQAALIHHMAYRAYQSLKSEDAEAAARKIDDQQVLLRKFSTLFAVGPRLRNNAEFITGRSVIQLVPGFPDIGPSRSPDGRLEAIAMGRLDRGSDRIKQGRLAAAAFGRAIGQASHRPPEALADPLLRLMGADPADLGGDDDPRAIANHEAGGQVAVLPTAFDEDPVRVMSKLSESNLSLMLSLREGFGLTGWEAIAAEVPLIVSKASGLYDLLRALGGSATGCVRAVDIKGALIPPYYLEADRDVVADAITAVASDLPGAKADARALKALLVQKFGCSWARTARDFLNGLPRAPLIVDPSKGRSTAPPRPSGPASPFSTNQSFNNIPGCAEMTVGSTQGSTAEIFDLLPEVRFGVQSFDVDGLRVTYGIKTAILSLTMDGCEIRQGTRLGDHEASSPHVAAMGDGRWRIDGPKDGETLLRKPLGDEALCTVEAFPGGGELELHLECSRQDLHYVFDVDEGSEVSVTKQRILEVFLSKCVGVAGRGNGDISLSHAVLTVGREQ